MRRILTAALASSLVALAIPAAASAHHAGRHHARGHARHHAHMVVFAPKTRPAGTTSGTEETPPTTEPVAKIASFEGGVLKITLADGSTVSGKVTEATEIECGDNQSSQDEQQGSGDEQQGSQHDGSGDWSHEGGSGDGGPGSFQHDEMQAPQGETESSCGATSLVAGAKVKEAELKVSGAGAVWDKIELMSQSQSSSSDS